jgi:transcriptional regulator GlxA family with amidase domain
MVCVNIGIVAFDGADEVDFVGPYEVWRHAASLLVNVDVGLYVLGGAREIVAAHGLRVQTEGGLPKTLDLLIVPGGGWTSFAPAGVRAEIEAGALPAAIAAYHAAGTRIAAVCTGTMAVAASGILGSRPAITHRGAIEDLRLTGARVIDARVVDDGDIVTCGGVSSGIDLALYLVEDAYGAAIAKHIARYLEYDRDPAIWRSAASVA